ncbi:MAG: beta-glucoside-specific PTS transporter subunit IIABC [Erysipelotrichaceae bacterium]
MKDYSKLASDIIENVGGKDNIISVLHCVTRLRFKLKDDSLANTDALKKMNGVVTVMMAGGQYQVVIGNHVDDVFKVVCKQAGIDSGVTVTTDQKDKPKGFKAVIDFIMAATTPTLPLLCASGILKGILTLCLVAGIMSDKSGIYILLNAIGDAFFFFMPAFFGYNVSKKMNSTPYLGMLIGLILCYPAINGIDIDLFGFVVNAKYSASFLPVIILAILAAPIEKWLNKVLPDSIKTFFTPLLVLIIVVPIGFAFIGPVANNISSLLGQLLTGLFDINPIFAGFIFGGIWQVLVMFGIHGMITLASFMAVLSGTPDSLLAVTGVVCFAQTATVFAVYLKTKSKQLKDIALPAAISGIFGVTEPAIYGVTLPRIKTFVISCIGGAISGMLIGLFNIKKYTYAGMGVIGLTGLLSPTNPQVLEIFITVVAGAIVSFVLTMIFYKDESFDLLNIEEEKKKTRIINKETIVSPIEGETVSLREIDDQAFADGTLGNGIAIIPSVGEVRAPFNGTVMALYPTKHAIGLVSDNGCEVLIHIGMDTVRLEGDHFETHVKQNDKIKQGDLLVSFDIGAIKAAGYEIETPIIVTNTKDYLDVVSVAQKDVKCGDDLITVLL